LELVDYNLKCASPKRQPLNRHEIVRIPFDTIISNLCKSDFKYANYTRAVKNTSVQAIEFVFFAVKKHSLSDVSIAVQESLSRGWVSQRDNNPPLIKQSCSIF
jgi:hypothetical protein